MIKKLIAGISAFLMLAAFSGCDLIGSGEATGAVETRGIFTAEDGTIEQFTVRGVYFIGKGRGQIKIVACEENKVEVTCPEDFFEHISTEFYDGKLTVKGDNRIYKLDDFVITLYARPEKISVLGSYGIDAEIAAAEKVTVDIDGAADGRFYGIDCRSLDVTVEGAGRIELSGKTDGLSCRINGAGELSAWELESKEAELRIDGAGKIGVNVTEKLSVKINGAGTVEYSGSPKDIEKDISGLGTVKESN